MLEPSHPVLVRFKARKPQTINEFAAWVARERKIGTDGQGQAQTGKNTRSDKDDEQSGTGHAGVRIQAATRTDKGVKARVSVCERPCQSLSSSCLVFCKTENFGLDKLNYGLDFFVQADGRYEYRPRHERKNTSIRNLPQGGCDLSSFVPHSSMAFDTSVSAASQNTAKSSKSSQSKRNFKLYRALAANGALSLLNLACYLLDCQVDRLAQDFENEGGFTERLYKVRAAGRRVRHD